MARPAGTLSRGLCVLLHSQEVLRLARRVLWRVWPMARIPDS